MNKNTIFIIFVAFFLFASDLNALQYDNEQVNQLQSAYDDFNLISDPFDQMEQHDTKMELNITEKLQKNIGIVEQKNNNDAGKNLSGDISKKNDQKDTLKVLKNNKKSDKSILNNFKRRGEAACTDDYERQYGTSTGKFDSNIITSESEEEEVWTFSGMNENPFDFNEKPVNILSNINNATMNTGKKTKNSLSLSDEFVLPNTQSISWDAELIEKNNTVIFKLFKIGSYCFKSIMSILASPDKLSNPFFILSAVFIFFITLLPGSRE